jgi:carboxyl-terminal processing protease
MPRRNFAIIIAVAIISLACGLKVDREGSILSYAMRQIRGRYLEDVDEKTLFEGAMDGMMRRLDTEFDDQHSAYIKPEKLQAFEETLSQKFGGVGMEVSMTPDTRQITVISPLPGSPAEEAGIRPGDKILKIDGESTQGLSLSDSVKLMHGETGTTVVLRVMHKGEDEPVDIEIVRAVIQVDTVVGRARNGDGSWDFFLEDENKIGYLRITSFADNTAEEMQKATQGLVDDGLRGLIIDLRNDPGGFLDQAVKISDMFIRSGVIVSTRRRHDQIFHTFRAKEKGTLPDFPIAVLVNRYTASAGEIVAACLQDHKRAVIVGERSFGKGTIQELIELESRHGMLKLTTGTYWRPSEKDINRRKGDDEDDDWGVKPNKGYEVALKKSSGNGNKSSGAKTPDADPQLERALEYIRSALEKIEQKQ